jgi:hypothetical protein
VRFGVLAAIDFDDELSLQADEVCDVWADGNLSAELVSVDLTHSR